MYDPARDLFQPTADAHPPLSNEENKSPPAHRDVQVPEQVLEQVLTASSPQSDPKPKVPSPTMSSEAVKKRRRSSSPASRPGLTDDATSSPPPRKKRRSPLSEQSVSPSFEAKPPSPLMHKPAEAYATTSEVGSDLAEKETAPTEAERRRDVRTPPREAGSPKSTHNQPSGTDSSQTYARNDQRNGYRSQFRRRSRPRSPTCVSPSKASESSAYHRRDHAPPRRRSRSPSPIRRSPPREEQPSRRPGGGSGRGRNVFAIAQRLAEEREREQEARNAQIQRERGVQHMSNQFYNARPEWVKERGREWRKNESKIKGLRSFNNWIKSCIIQKFSPEEAPQAEDLGWGEEPKAPAERKPLLILDLGCGKGGDLGKWQLAPQTVGLYVGLDPADQSIAQARDRYNGMRRGRKPIFDGRFHVKDCFGEWVGDVPIVREVGIDPNAGRGGPSKWSGGGFDVVSMMFSMHYAFESEQKARTMLRNVAGSLKKGGRFIGVVPNSDAIAEQVIKWCETNKDKKHGGAGASENTAHTGDGVKKENDANFDEAPHWGNALYNVRFGTDRPVPTDGIFRDPPFGWKYMYWMEEAVDVPEYVVPWEAFRAVAEGFNLEQRYRKPFLEVWEAEKDDRELSRLSVRMGVTGTEGGELGITADEREAVRFYHAFCFVKV